MQDQYLLKLKVGLGLVNERYCEKGQGGIRAGGCILANIRCE